MSNTGPELHTQISFAADLTHLIREKLLESVQYIPYSEEASRPAVDAGWFCIEPPVYSPEPIQGSDAFSISYTGLQEGLGRSDAPSLSVRSTVTSLELFKNGHPYSFEEDQEASNGISYSVLAGNDAPPIIVNQTLLAAAIERQDTPLSGLGNWHVVSIANRLSANGIQSRVLSGPECRSILKAVARSRVDDATLIRSLQHK